MAEVAHDSPDSADPPEAAPAYLISPVQRALRLLDYMADGGATTQLSRLARELDIRMIDTVCISSYDETNIRDSEILKRVGGDGQGWLIIDDLVDTGTTGRIVREMLPKAHFATVYAKPAGRPVVDTFITEVSQDTWILFPWDTEPQPSPPIARSRAAS